MVRAAMKDSDCVQFLQWCLPGLRLRWAGFRRVRRQVCRRIVRRLNELGLSDVSAYRSYLESDPAEWRILDALCRVPISRFYRDRGVFQFQERDVLPRLAQMAAAQGENDVRCWSIGCASGEEPYTVAILWRLRLAPRFPSLRLRILATDADPHAIERAVRACYPPSSLKQLPEDLRSRALIAAPGGFCVREEYRGSVTFQDQDIRRTAPDGMFHLILCRNLAFTYFDEALQRETLHKIAARLFPGGALVIGRQEHLPDGVSGFEPWSSGLATYRRVPER